MMVLRGGFIQCRTWLKISVWKAQLTTALTPAFVQSSCPPASLLVTYTHTHAGTNRHDELTHAQPAREASALFGVMLTQQEQLQVKLFKSNWRQSEQSGGQRVKAPIKELRRRIDLRLLRAAPGGLVSNRNQLLAFFVLAFRRTNRRQEEVFQKRRSRNIVIFPQQSRWLQKGVACFTHWLSII